MPSSVLSPSCAHSLLRSFIRLHGVNHNQPFPTAASLHKIFTSFTIFIVFQCFRSIASLPCKIVWEIDTTSFQEIILSSGVFRRETASGFYPWSKAHNPSAKCEAFHVAPRLFFMFLFLITFTIRQQCIIYPQKFSTVPASFRPWLFGGVGHSGF